MTFKTTKDGQVKDRATIGDFNFLTDEGEGEDRGGGEDGYFKAGVYIQ